jgi:hypothetical protein
MFDVLLNINLETIKNDLINKGRGFSFIIYLYNRLFDIYLKLFIRTCTIRRNGLFNGKNNR